MSMTPRNLMSHIRPVVNPPRRPSTVETSDKFSRVSKKEVEITVSKAQFRLKDVPEKRFSCACIHTQIRLQAPSM